LEIVCEAHKIACLTLEVDLLPKTIHKLLFTERDADESSDSAYIEQPV
jgi:hypothetical protein